MKLSYKLKVFFANKGKLIILKTLINFWISRVNYFIIFYWQAPDWELKRSKPPKERQGTGSKLENLASVKVWQMVSLQKEKPVLKELSLG
jgi:hypothetical protein